MILFESGNIEAAFYFSAEEYIIKILKPEELVLMLWSTGDTVMIGANQIIKAEINEAYVKKAGIDIVRRASGGGTIFTDRKTLQYTIILKHNEDSQNNDPKAVMKEWLAEPLIRALSTMGVSASLEGRNDVTLDGKKISGLAQYVRNGYMCRHGSLLYDTDLEKLSKTLTVDREKIKSKAIASVNARVAKIADHLKDKKDLPTFREALIESYGQKEPIERKEFTKEELKTIEDIKSERFGNESWTYGHEPEFTYTNKKRFPGGAIEVFLDVKGGEIKTASIKGDFLALRPVSDIEEGLIGVAHRENALREALHSLDVESALGSLTEKELLETLVG